MNSGVAPQTNVLTGRRVLVDSELLVLLCVGLEDPNRIRTTDVTKAFSEADFVGLTHLLSAAHELVLTQAVLAEASNHLDRKEWSRSALLGGLARLIQKTPEVVVLSKTVAGHPYFPALGFADSALWVCALDEDCTVLTKDRRLAGLLRVAGVRVVNFNDFRHLWMASVIPQQ